jgi:hypothetical protein
MNKEREIDELKKSVTTKECKLEELQSGHSKKVGTILKAI